MRVDLADLARRYPCGADVGDPLRALGNDDSDAVADGPLAVLAKLKVGGVVVGVLRPLSEPVRARREAGLFTNHTLRA